MKKYTIKDGRELIIRKSEKSDAVKVIEYMSVIGGESDYLTFGGVELTIPLEKEEQIIEAINSKDNSIMFIAAIDGEIAGNITFRGGEKERVKHTGEFGITVRKAYWNLGIGNILLDSLIDWARGTGIVKKINLRVRTDNEKGIALYKKHGFQEEGRVTREFCIDGIFYDSMIMGFMID